MSLFSTKIKYRRTLLELKNIVGWKTQRKIIVLSFDDYGNVRLASKEAREKLDQSGLRIFGRFDAYDTLETRQDLEILFGVLSSVSDINGRHAVLTPFTVPCNIDFERMSDDKYQKYYYELLPQTYLKLSAYDPASYNNTWKLWQEGISKALLMPQFHGREHLNLKVFEEKMKNKDKDLMICLKNRSFTSLSNSGYPTISLAAAFDFWNFKENTEFERIIEDGLNCFEEVFGYRSVHFNPPAGREHPIVHGYLKANGIKYIDTPFIKREHTGKGKYKTVINYTGKQNRLKMIYIVRNVVFEPTQENGNDWVSYTLRQIEAAFRWRVPAIISSHRVNYCGYISEKNRNVGITSLKTLLKEIVRRWPDVEFMAANELGDLITERK